MKIVEIKGNLFDHVERGDSIAHGANCVGVMGAGVAKHIKAFSESNFLEYEALCKKYQFLASDILRHKDLEKGVTIYNLATQIKPGRQARMLFVEVAVNRMIVDMESRNLDKVKTVQIGCGIGGLDWSYVKPMLEEIPTDITMEVYYL